MRPMMAIVRYGGVLLIFCALSCWNLFADDQSPGGADSVNLLLEPSKSLLGRIETGGEPRYSLLLERGELYLALGEVGRARADFSATYWDDDPEASSGRISAWAIAAAG